MALWPRRAAAAAGGPAAALSIAAADIKSLPADRALNARYLDCSAISEGQRPDFNAALLFHVNCISRNSDFVALVPVGPGLFRVDIRDPSWEASVWDLLERDEPYYHSRLKAKEDLTIQTPFPGGKDAEGTEFKRDFYPQKVKAGEEFSAFGPWLNAEEALALSKATFSKVPIVRADWFFVQTAANVDRRAGYYKLLGLKTKADIFDLAGLDVAKAQKIQREVAAIVAKSGVALHNRQIFRFGAIAGGVWITFDTKSNKGKQNAKVQLNGDFTDNADANEIYFSLPNRLWGLAAANNKDGKLQDTVPDFIAGDDQSSSNDHRIHASISCVRCHIEGLRPIDDYARKFYTVDPKKGGALLTSPDYAKFQRLRRIYLGDLESEYLTDQDIYARALVRLLGKDWTPARVAEVYRDAWYSYEDDTVSAEQLALELGCSVEHMRKAFAAANLAKGAQGSAAMIGYLRDPPFEISRQHIEEEFAEMALAVRGLIAP